MINPHGIVPVGPLLPDYNALHGRDKLPAAAKPGTTDEIAIVKKAPHSAAAKAFVADVLSAKGQATLKAAGFGPPPK